MNCLTFIRADYVQIRAVGAERLRNGNGGCCPGSIGRNDRLYFGNLQRTDRVDQKFQSDCVEIARPVRIQEILAPHQRQFPLLRTAGYRYRHLFAGTVDDLPAGASPDRNLVLLFGLIVASAAFVARDIRKWNLTSLLGLLVGTALAFWITIASPTQTPNDWWFIMLSGAVAICAMILPGISGAFILLLLGKYQYILQAVSEFRLGVLLLFAVGAVAGIISFSHLLSWLLRKHHDLTISLLMGFMVGSLNKVWPWKEVVETYTDAQGAVHPLVEQNITPGHFEAIGQTDAHLWQAVALALAGFLLIYVIEFIGKRVAQKISAPQN